jgi:hypothetical protein
MVPEILVKTVPVTVSPFFSGSLKSSRSRLEFREQNKNISFLFPKTRTRKKERRKEGKKEIRKKDRNRDKEVPIEREKERKRERKRESEREGEIV